jgi:hypothetical protein
LTLASDLGDRREEANALVDAGVIACEAGDHATATDLLLRGLDLAGTIHSDVLLAAGLEGLAAVAAMVGDASRAARLLGGAERIREQASYRRSAADDRRLQELLHAAKAKLGPARWAAAVDAGRGLEAAALLAEASRGP